MSLETKTTTAIATLKKSRKLIVALSGGVDSAVLLHLAVRALGAENVVAATGQSAAVPGSDLEDAEAVARCVGVRLERVATYELEQPDYVANRGDRCFHCREELFQRLAHLGRRLGILEIAYGAIVDDLGDNRPGMRSAEQRSVRSPLLDAGLTKADIREVARAAGLPVRDKPASPCLASRLPVGTVVTSERLARIEVAETGLRALGLTEFRVRDHFPLARVELDAEGLSRSGRDAFRSRIESVVRGAGFANVEIDPAGYGGIGPIRSGGQ
ncbi:MAG: ATP-dependent sacrificial sulfur transferase LarE [Acidobacteriota bacterium]|nr:ATP-dependent sacrificial sulfur transferase LarE [Acidobacteriota bacterium]MDH3786432.1 ATP-dependent sacrificial sulfur transferase LarE [Acidobacteriota bacterium]